MHGTEFPPPAGDGSATTSNELVVDPAFPITEDVIERFVRYPETLSEEVRSAVRRYVSANLAAQSIAEFYRQFYEDLGTTGACSDPRLEILIRALVSMPAVPPPEPETSAGTEL